ncbi:MAG TPA: hypothetical protein DEA82_15180 [Flavobacteriaceae bacterium]|nr:hypothetical protein [Flavobacteriaceae bacterium]MAY53914.1 hypothetical protein [Flavobacteriaceae bacterium]HBR55450.1 hypothetical protein [Flavobacteriaceae bacterium]
MSSTQRFLRPFKKIHVLLVRWGMDTRNYYQLLQAKRKGKNIVYVHFARVNNFGDQFNYDLTRFFGTQLIYTHSYKKSQMALCGSILGSYLRDYTGYVLGAGFIAARYNRRGNDWKVKIIRGPLSAAQCGLKDDGVVYADPGILASQIYPKSLKKKYKLGVLPHSKDVAQMEKLPWPEQVKLIHPRRNPSEVAAEIKQCDHIVSSSLHGLIFADAFRIPNIHLKISNQLTGGLHKFKDYYQGMNMEYENVKWSQDTAVDDLISACKLRCTDNYLAGKQKEVAAIIKEILAAESLKNK